MRLIALCGLLAVASPVSLCERRNPTVCSLDPGFECTDGKFCSIATGESTGKCVQAECTTASNTCSSDHPICLSGRCVPCQGNQDCQSLNNPDAPICSAGKCVGCASNVDCTVQTAPICDSVSHTCRACQTHGDCSSVASVCAKDDTFANLSTTDQSLNIPKGSCVPASKINVVDPSCAASTCSLATELALVSVQRPYVRVGSVNTTNTVTIPPLPTPPVPTFYIVGPTADFAPSRTIPVAPASITPPGTGLSIPAGSHTIIEGMVLNQSNVGLDCVGGAQTKVKLIRSLVAQCATGIKAGPRCELSIDSSWIGKGPPDPRLSVYGANAVAMQLNSTQLEVVNSVFFHNGGGSGVFGGVSLSDSMGLNPLVRFINTTFDNHIFADPTRKTLAVDCNYMTNGKVTFLNTLFLNPSAPGALFTYVNSNCRQGANPVASIGSNEAGLSCPSSCVTNVDESIFVDASLGDLHLKSTAPTSITAGGTTQFTDSVGQVPVPTADIDGVARGASAAIGAFNPSP